MPVTIEEVIAEVPPERPAPPAERAHDAAPADDPGALEALAQALRQRAERDWRLHAD